MYFYEVNLKIKKSNPENYVEVFQISESTAITTQIWTTNYNHVKISWIESNLDNKLDLFGNCIDGEANIDPTLFASA